MFRRACRRLCAAPTAAAPANGNGYSYRPVRVGDTIPDAQVFVGMPPKAASVTKLLAGRRTFLLTVPGAYTSKCSTQLPDVFGSVDEIRRRFDVTAVMVAATNDSFVMEAWKRAVVPGAPPTPSPEAAKKDAAKAAEALGEAPPAGGSFGWVHQAGAGPVMVADPQHQLLEAVGHAIDLPVLGGDRFARAAFVIDDGKVERIWEEADGKALAATACAALLADKQ